MAEDGNGVDNFQKEIHRARNLTQKPFGVNIPLDLRESGLLIDTALRENITIVITSSGDPGMYADLIHSKGGIVLHVVGTVEQARKAEGSGVDALIVEGCEAGGHLGFNEIPLFSILPQVTDVVSIPVIAAGGIIDARGFLAAICLGAEGIQMGTRFVAVKENPASLKYKEAILSAGDTDTIITSRKLSPTRSLNTGFVKSLKRLEDSGATKEELQRFLGFRRARKAQLDGDLNQGEAYAGASAGLIHKIDTVGTVIEELVSGYERIVNSLSQ
jgi:enoyl-[acyl-carrier protein] reductase II